MNFHLIDGMHWN